MTIRELGRNRANIKAFLPFLCCFVLYCFVCLVLLVILVHYFRNVSQIKRLGIFGGQFFWHQQASLYEEHTKRKIINNLYSLFEGRLYLEKDWLKTVEFNLKLSGAAGDYEMDLYTEVGLNGYSQHDVEKEMRVDQHNFKLICNNGENKLLPVDVSAFLYPLSFSLD